MSEPAAETRATDTHALVIDGRRALVVGIAGVALCAAGGLFDRTQFFRSYLIAFALWFGAPLGSLVVLMMHHLVGGGWGFIIRRPLEAAARTIPVLLLLALPIFLGLHALYAWADPSLVASSSVLQQKHAYLNVPLVLVRAGLYFAVWIALSGALNRWAAAQDAARTGAEVVANTRKLYALSGPGIVIYALTVSFASVDWLMSLEADWFSTIFSAVFMMGQVLTALCVMTILTGRLVSRGALVHVATPRYFNDLGNLLLAFVMLWTYMAFSQFLIIWAGDLPDEIVYYVHRTRNGWQWVSASLILFHFAVPFLFLLWREVKRDVHHLVKVAWALLLMRAVDMWWNVTPAYSAGVRAHWMDVAAIVGVGGLWVAAFLHQLGRRPLLPVHDPDLPAVVRGATEPS